MPGRYYFMNPGSRTCRFTSINLRNLRNTHSSYPSAIVCTIIYALALATTHPETRSTHNSNSVYFKSELGREGMRSIVII